MFYTWLVVSAVMAIVEIITLGLVSVWFCVGALSAAILSLFIDNAWWQLLSFIVISGFTMYLFFGVFKLRGGPNGKYIATNADAIVGNKAIVTQEISSIKNQGQIKIKGQFWSATTTDLNIVIPKGAVVEVTAIQGVKAVVKTYTII